MSHKVVRTSRVHLMRTAWSATTICRNKWRVLHVVNTWGAKVGEMSGIKRGKNEQNEDYA